jgi:hypothetical protein
VATRATKDFKLIGVIWFSCTKGWDRSADILHAGSNVL